MERIYRIYKETPAETFYDHKGMLRVAEKIASRNSLDPDPVCVKEFDSKAEATAFYETCKPIINIYRGYGSVKELQVEFFSLQAIDIDDDDDETAYYITDNSPTLEEILDVIDPKPEMFHVELCCDRFVEGQGFDTNGSVIDTFDTDDVDGIDIEDALDNMDYKKHNLVDGEDYKIWVRVYNSNGYEIQHDIDFVWESEL